MKLHVSYKGYRYDPCQWIFYVNEKMFAPMWSDLAHDCGYLCMCGKYKEAEDKIKREYRKQFKARRRCTIGFFGINGSRQFYYTSQLGAYDDDLQDKLRVFKEWKRYCESKNWVMQTHEITEGEFIPGHKGKTETHMVEEIADPKRPVKLYFRERKAI